MANVLDKDIVKNIDAMDMVLGTIAKPFIETGVSKVVGNGNIVSGIVKLGGALALAKYGGKDRLTKSLAIGAGMDGSEDMVVSVSGKMGIESAETTETGFKF